MSGIYGHGGHLGHVTKMISWSCDQDDFCKIYLPFSPKKALHKFDFDWPSGLREKDI